MSADKERDLSLDAVCGFFIIIMMLWHTRLITEEMYHVEHFFYFFLPWFFFKAGMFAKYGAEQNRGFIIKSAKRLLVPCIIFAIYGLMVQIVTDQIIGGRTIIGTIYTHAQQVLLYGTAISNKPVWFLITLFCARQIFAFTSRHNIVLVSVIVALLVAQVHQFLIYNNYCFVGNIPLGYLYYVAGYYFKEKQYNKWVVMASLILIALVFILIPTNVDFRGNCIYYGNYLIGVVCAVLGVIIMNNLFRLKWIQLKSLIYIGQNSIPFLVIHYPIIWLTQAVCRKHMDDSYSISIVCTVVIFIVSFAFTYLINKSKYKWIVGG